MLTSRWKGERFPDGRPKVPDELLERLKPLSLEDIWGVLQGNEGYQNQFEGNWQIVNPDSVMTGRVVTAQYMPLRPDLDSLIKAEGKGGRPRAAWGHEFLADRYFSGWRRIRGRQL